MALLKHIITAFLFLFFVANSHSQVNTEALRRDFKSDGFFNQINLDFGLTTGNTQYTSVLTGYRADWFTGKNHVFGIINYAYSQDEVKKKENKGFVHLRYIYDLNQYFALEGFLQKEFNEFILLNDRNLLGLGSRVRLFNYEADSAKTSSFVCYLGLGGMLENEVIEGEGTGDNTKIRMTSYLNLSADINSYLAFKFVGYYQPDFADFSDYRVLSESGLIVKITKIISMKTALRLRYDSKPPASIKPLDLNLTNGLQIEF